MRVMNLETDPEADLVTLYDGAGREVFCDQIPGPPAPITVTGVGTFVLADSRAGERLMERIYVPG